MPWIKTIPYAAAQGRLKKLYDRIKGPDDRVDNIMMSHSLRPHSMEGHMALYKNVLHHSGNRLPKWLLEALGTYVSHLNACDYCFQHHLAGRARLIGDDTRSAAIKAALVADRPEDAFDGRELAAMGYAKALTTAPAAMAETHVLALRDSGLDDGEILEINQVVSYFAYANRTVLGLGTSIKGEVLGLSPGDSDDPDNWSHG
ncbi:MAG: carboxymuconolactone decarboxylase family protein [Pseudomonadota bacterium]